MQPTPAERPAPKTSGLDHLLRRTGVRSDRNGSGAAQAPNIVECHDCGLFQTLPAAVPDRTYRCMRCEASFGCGIRPGDAALALAMTSLVLFLLANTFPLLGINVAGRTQSVRLSSGVDGLAAHGLAPLGLFVLAISIIAPVGRVLGLGYVLVQLRRDRRPGHLAPVLRVAEKLQPWAMLDVFLIGALISLTKLHALAEIQIGVGFWSLGLLVIALAAFEMTVDQRLLWAELRAPPAISATSGFVACGECGLVQDAGARCIRCGDGLHRRKPESLSRATALVLTGLVLYIPANLYPVMTVVSFGRRGSATIMGGVLELLSGSDWPLALIVFIASVAVPLLKLVGLAWLLISTRIGLASRLKNRTRLYRLIELVSRWSTVDIFVAALLTALVTLGNVATIEPGLGALAFGAVVFVTMLATDCFDPRLMWDVAGANNV